MKNHFAKLIWYMKNAYHIDRGLNRLSDGEVNVSKNRKKVIVKDVRTEIDMSQMDFDTIEYTQESLF